MRMVNHQEDLVGVLFVEKELFFIVKKKEFQFVHTSVN